MNNKKESICVNCKNCMVRISRNIRIERHTLMRITTEEETHNCLLINEVVGMITSCSKFILDDKNN